MSDRPRLRDDSASFEGRLLRSSTRLDPPDSAEEELWQRLKLASAVAEAGVLGGSASHASAAPASRAAGTALAAQLIKWSGIAVVAISAVTATMLWVLPQHGPSASRAALPGSTDRASQLRVESGELRAARSKLAAGDFQGALADTARLSAQFPHGVLSQEREVVAIDALTGLGEGAAARSRAQAFLARYPDSPYAARLRRLVAGN
jgi:hypothetical protein